MSTTVAQRVFPPGTVVSIHEPQNVEIERNERRAPFEAGIAAVSSDTPAVKATKTIDPTGTNNAIDYTAHVAGAAGNLTTVQYKIDGASSALSVDVEGHAIIVTLATDSGSVGTSTAGQVRTAIAARPSAAALVDTANHAGNDGTGVLVATAATPLTGGLDETDPNSVVIAADATLTATVSTGATYAAHGVVNGESRWMLFGADA